MKRLIFASMLALSTAAHATGDFYTGNEIHAYLGGEQGGTKRAAAMGYVAGVVIATQRTHCAPESITIGQSVDIVRNFLANNPQIRHMSAAVLILAAIFATWPCQEENRL